MWQQTFLLMPRKTYLVVGGTSGIGKALVEKLEGSDHDVLIAARHEADFTLDVTRDVFAPGTLPAVLHGLAYLPGSLRLRPFHQLEFQEFRDDFEINVVGAVRVLQACWPSLKKAEGASVVLASTVAAGTGMPFHTSIGAAKGAVEGLVRALAAEWAPKIRVNAVAPSLTDTPLAATLLNTDRKKEAASARHPMKRYGQPGDIATAIAYLLSSEASWVTGQVLPVDGGLSALRSL